MNIIPLENVFFFSICCSIFMDSKIPEHLSILTMKILNILTEYDISQSNI